MAARHPATRQRRAPREAEEPLHSKPAAQPEGGLHGSPRQAAQRHRLEAAFGPSPASAPVQRMVALAAKDMSAVDDALVFNNLDYARGHFGDPVGDFESNRKFDQTRAGDRLGIVAHGEPGKIGDYDAPAVADALTRKPGGPIHKDLSSIVLYSCFAGMAQDMQKPDSTLVHGLSAELKKRNYEIGVEGMAGIGFGFKGIGERTTTGSLQQVATKWFGVRDQLLKKPAYQAWGTPGQGFVTADKLIEVAGGRPPSEITKMTLEEKGAAIADIMAPFWREVEPLMGASLYAHLKGWVRVKSYLSGESLVQDSR